MRTRPALATVAIVLTAVLSGCGALTTPSSPRPDIQDDDDFGSVEVYAVDDRGALSPQPTDAGAARVWDLFVRVVTPEFAAAGMSQYRAGSDADSDTLAYVHRDDDPRYWVLAANLAFADDEDLLLSTLVHEYAHILSLSTAEVDPDAVSCDTWETSEGCVSPSSALARFDAEFWTAYGDDAPAADADDADAADEFYLAHEDDFVSDYAATNVVEDFAESFMTYVLEDDPDGDAPVARKLRFFAALPDYAAARERIRAEFGLG